VEVTKQHKAAEWLLDGENPAVRYWTLRDILGKAETDDEVVQAREHIATWTPVAEYLREQHSDGYWGFGRRLLAEMDGNRLAVDTASGDWYTWLASFDPKSMRIFFESHGYAGSALASAEIS